MTNWQLFKLGLLVTVPICCQAGMIEVVHDPLAQLFAEYEQPIVDDVMGDLTAEIQPSSLSFEDSNVEPQDMNESLPLFELKGPVGYQDLALIKQWLGADAQLIKSEYLKFKQDFTQFVGLSAQAQISTVAVYDQVLVSASSGQLHLQGNRYADGVQLEQSSWFISTIKKGYTLLMSPVNLLITLLLLCLVVIFKRRFFPS